METVAQIDEINSDIQTAQNVGIGIGTLVLVILAALSMGD